MDWQIFKDKELTEPVSDPIDLGKLKAGEKKQFVYYIFNSSVNPFDEVRFSVDNKEVKVISPIEEIDVAEKTSTKIILEWEPSIDVKRGLKTSLKIEGFEVFKG